MRFMVLVYPGNRKDYEAGRMPEQKLLEDMGKFNEELVNAGVMLSGEGMHPSSKGARRSANSAAASGSAWRSREPSCGRAA